MNFTQKDIRKHSVEPFGVHIDAKVSLFAFEVVDEKDDFYRLIERCAYKNRESAIGH